MHHLACMRELAEGKQSFHTRCESNVCQRFALLFCIVLSVERPLEGTILSQESGGHGRAGSSGGHCRFRDLGGHGGYGDSGSHGEIGSSGGHCGSGD